MTNPQDPQNPYGDSPQYGAPQYGTPEAPMAGQSYPQGYPVGPGVDQPSKGMAVTSLVLSVIGCTIIAGIVSIVLAVIVLRRGRDGRDHGKGFAIAGLVISILSVLGSIAFIALVAVGVNNLTTVNELDAGDCITAKGLAGEGDTVTDIEKIACSSPHDGEVLTASELTVAQAEAYDNESSLQLCIDALAAAGKSAVVTGDVNVIGLTQTLEPDPGDTLACVAFNADGSKLTGKLE